MANLDMEHGHWSETHLLKHQVLELAEQQLQSLQEITTPAQFSMMVL
jgi:hypothetical protein